jgi:Flp pilus assembly protein TadG
MKKLKNESGSVLVFITLMIVILMVMVGMGLDTGMLTYSRSMGQRAVDMAALSGSAGLAKGDVAAIESNIEQLNATNDYIQSSGNPIDGQVNAGSGTGKNVTLMKYNFATNTLENAPVPLSEANAVRVALEGTNPYSGGASNSAVSTPAFLTPLINLFGGGASASAANNVNVSAVAVYSAIPGIPLTIGQSECTTGVQNLFFQSPSGGESPNNSAWTTYTVRETNTPGIIRRITEIVNCQGGGAVSIGTEICISNGQNTPVVEAFGELADPSGNKCYYTPVLPSQNTWTGCSGDSNKILAWAEVCILHVCAPPDSNKNPNCANKGDKYIVANVKSCNLDDNARVGQCFSHKLVREPQVGM